MMSSARRRALLDPPFPPGTVVSFHAHPDDESLLTGGTLAWAAATGRRVVLVVATDGAAGLSPLTVSRADLASCRQRELQAAAAALGCARVVALGFPDSGIDGSGSGREGETPFCRVSVEDGARALADVLIEEDAALLTIYDAAGGYGHPDHLQVHRVGMRAAALAGTPRVWAATVDRDRFVLLSRALRLAARIARLPPLPDPRHAYTPRRAITYRFDVRDYLGPKRCALQAHGSQTGGGAGPRTIALLLRLPRPLFRWICGWEWFIECAGADASPHRR